MSASRVVLAALVLVVGACSSTTQPTATTADPDDGGTLAVAPSSMPDTAANHSPSGTASVSVEGERLVFALDVCTIEDDVLEVEGWSGERRPTLLHASPPTRQPQEPSFSVFVIDGESRYEAPPAAVQLDEYDPAAGRAIGRALDVVVGADPSRVVEATFEIACHA